MTPRQAEALQIWAAQVIDGQTQSQVFLLLWDDAIVAAPDRQALPVLQIGYALVLDQPIVIVAKVGAQIPDRLRSLAVAVEHYESGTLSSMKAAILKAMTAAGALEAVQARSPGDNGNGSATKGRELA
jgi:hypothetical protein